MDRMELDANPFASFAGRNVFVTGHTGFKGSWLAIWLARLGANVTGYALPPETNPNNFAASCVEDCLVDHHASDIRDVERVRQALEAARPDFVFHLAAQPLVHKSYRQPRETIDVNVLGTVNVLDAVRAWSNPCVVIVVTSDKCYAETNIEGGCRESHPLGGQDPYSASKAATEIVTNSFRSSYFAPADYINHGVQLATVRAGNVIGGGDWAEDRIVTDIVRSLQSNKPVQLRNPRAVRPWQHVLDALAGYLLLSQQMQSTLAPELATAWNFGPHNDFHPVHEVTDAFIKTWGAGSWESVGSPASWSEAMTLTLNTEKARRELGWKTVWDFTTTIDRTANWYRRFFDDPHSANDCKLCVDDIRGWQQGWAESTRPSIATPLGVLLENSAGISSPLSNT